MGVIGKNTPKSVNWRILVGMFCVALLLLGTSMQVAHTHASGLPGGPDSHADCSLCVSAHHSLGPAVSEQVAITLIVARAEVVQIQPNLKFRFVAFSLWNRPPPEGPARS